MRGARGTHRPDVGLFIGGAGQDVVSIWREAGADVEAAVAMAAEAGQRLRVRALRVVHVVGGAVAAHQQASA